MRGLATECGGRLGRASARETASRVGAGAIARCLLKHFGVETFGFTRQILDARTDVIVREENWRVVTAPRDASDTHFPDENVTPR